jgi:hypothetical protein
MQMERTYDRRTEQTQTGAQGFVARDIRPLFRDVDISHMKAHGIKLDDYTFMSEPDNANKMLGAVSPHEDDPPAMPPGGPHWTADQLALFAQWQQDGYQP